MLKNSKFIVGNNKITICGISVDNEGLPKVKYTLLINQDLKFKVWHDEKNVPSRRYEHILKGKAFSYFNEIIQVIEYLQDIIISSTTNVDEARYHIELLNDIEYPDESLRLKLMFLIEQMKLAFMHIKHRRYSSELLVYFGRIHLLTCIDRYARKGY